MNIDIYDLIPDYTENKKIILNPDWLNIKNEDNAIYIISEDDKMTYMDVHNKNETKILKVYTKLDNNCTSSINMSYYFKYDERNV